MGHQKNVSLLATALMALGASAASAADLDPGYGMIPSSQQERVEFGTGWYVRGDIGATHGANVTAGDEPYNTTLYTQHPDIPATYTSSTDANTGIVTRTQVTPDIPATTHPIGISQGPGQTPPSLNVGSFGALNYTASLGGGYQFNKWFRVDAIFDFHQPLQSTTQGVGRQCKTGTYGVGSTPYQYEDLYSTTCTPNLKASLKSYDALINGYVDLGTWYSVTPYIGAGVGLSFGHAQTSSQYVQNNNVAYNANYTDALSGSSFNQNWDRSQSKQYYNLAFALMGGIAIDVFDHTKLDIGYRYLNLGSVFGTTIATQEVRAGLRYMIDN